MLRTIGGGCARIALLVVVCVHLAACSAAPPEKKETSPAVEQWGVRVSSVRLTGAEHFVDFRYRVLDSEKAAVLQERKEKPMMIDQANGAQYPVMVTKLGAMRASGVKPKENKEYTILFSNYDKGIKAGSKVSVVIGSFKVENLTVE